MSARVSTRSGTGLLALAVLVLLEGCATSPPPRGNLLGGAGPHSRATSLRYDFGPGLPAATSESDEVEGSAGGFPERTADPFQVVQETSGLGEEARHPVGAALYVGQARELLGRLARTPVTAKSFAPRRVLSWLLREVLEGGERVEYAELQWRTERFWMLVLVRPDGYLVTALTGMPLQRLGPLELKGGEWKVAGLTVGDFYLSRSGVFYPVTEALRRADGPPLAELGLGRDPLNAALDGAQDALAEIAMALAQSILLPIRSLEDLQQLPTTVASLIASSPEYFARYGDMSREDQIREAARLSTHVLLMRGGAQATVVRTGGLGAGQPVLSLTARGELVLGGAVVVEGTAATAVAVDLGALSILHMASGGQGNPGGGASGHSGQSPQATSNQGPGKWTYKTSTTESKRSLEYQEQITGRPAWYVYRVGTVEFDGFNGKQLLEAKGRGYKNFIRKDGRLQPWYANGKGFKGLEEQARRQNEAAKTLKVQVVWHVAEVEFANFLRKFFANSGWTHIEVRHTRPVP
jgi:hypothetical protein